MSELTTDHEPRYLVVQRFHGDGWFAIKADSKGARRETWDAIATDDEFFEMVAGNPKRKWIAWGVSVGAACEALDAKNAPAPRLTGYASFTDDAPTPTIHSVIAGVDPADALRLQIGDELRRIMAGGRNIEAEIAAAKAIRYPAIDRPAKPATADQQPLSPHQPAEREEWAMDTGKWREGSATRDITGHPIVYVEHVTDTHVYTVSNRDSMSEDRRTYSRREFALQFVPVHAPNDRAPQVGNVWRFRAASSMAYDRYSPARCVVREVGPESVTYQWIVNAANGGQPDRWGSRKLSTFAAEFEFVHYQLAGHERY